MSETHKRISILLKQKQYESLGERGLNVSGLLRDLIDDYLSEYKITISVGEETKNLYDLVISNTGSSDEDLEVYLQEGLKSLLKDKISYMQKLVDDLEPS